MQISPNLNQKTDSSFFLIILLLTPGLDSVRFGWSSVLLLIKVLAFIGYLPATTFTLWPGGEVGVIFGSLGDKSGFAHKLPPTCP